MEPAESSYRTGQRIPTGLLLWRSPWAASGCCCFCFAFVGIIKSGRRFGGASRAAILKVLLVSRLAADHPTWWRRSMTFSGASFATIAKEQLPQLMGYEGYSMVRWLEI